MKGRDNRAYRCLGLLSLAAIATAALDCTHEVVAEQKQGTAQVSEDGKIVLTGCVSDEPIISAKSYAPTPPSGSCSAGDPACSVQTRQSCPSGATGPIVAWDCPCVDGAWSCTLKAVSGDLCVPLPNDPPAGDTGECAYDPANPEGIACEPGFPPCQITTTHTCSDGTQGKTNFWDCSCESYPTIPEGAHVWACARHKTEGQPCADNACPVIDSYAANPSMAAVGESIRLAASASDVDEDLVSFVWTTSTGRLVNPYVPVTNYTCGVAGDVTFTLTVSDGTCQQSIDVTVTCTP